MSVTTLRWPDDRDRFTDTNLDRAPVDIDPDDRPTRNPHTGTETADTPGIDHMGRFTAHGGDVVDVIDPATVDHYLNRGWEQVENDDTDQTTDS